MFSLSLPAQFQTSIGYPFPTNEAALRGLMTNSGDFLILADHKNHPLGIFNTLGDIQHVQLNSLGYVINPSKMLGQDDVETASWMEKTVCGNGGYIIAGEQNNGVHNDVIVTRTDLNCNPIWTKLIGTANANEFATCIKEDGNGDFILVGSKRVINGNYSIQAVKLDCAGNQIWNRIYTLPISVIATSVTEFTNLSAACSNLPNEYFISGVAVANNGNDEMFILSINAANGNLSWMNTYDVAPNTADYATCIQGSCLYNTQLNGELWVSGYSLESSTNKIHVFMMKTSITGNLLWANTYEIVGDVEVAAHFQFTNSGDLLITGRAEGLTSPPRPATTTGHCLLMKVSNNGNQVFWSRLYDQGFASHGSNVEPLINDEYLITGYTYKADPPAGFDFNILAIKTDSLGRTSSNCYRNPITDIIRRAPVATRAVPMVSSPVDFSTTLLLTKTYQDSQIFCIVSPRPKCDSLFTFLDQLHTIPPNCCFNLFVDNPTPNCFTKIQINLSSGSFNNVNAHGGWTTSGSGTLIEFVESSGFVPAGNSNPGSFCVIGVTNPYTMTVSYLYPNLGTIAKCEKRYILNCPALPFNTCTCANGMNPGPNLVNNGDFSAGNTGFTSSYIFQPTIALGNGQYSIRNSTNLINSQWACTDHTNGLPLGNFMVVDGGNTNACWRTNVNVVQGRQYSFCAFVNNLVIPTKNFADPVADLWINGSFLASVNLPEIPDVWVNLSASWTSLSNGTAIIEIRPGIASSNAGFDFAIDDIVFHECFTDTTCTTLACPNNLVQNSGFFQGAALGNLGSPGASSNWTTATQTPQVVIDSCCDPYAMLMWGNRDKGESICQNVNFQSGHTYNINFCARFYDDSQLPSKYIRFGFSAANACMPTYNCTTNCENIGQSGNITSQIWNSYSITNWTATSNWSNLIIRAFNNNPDITGNATTVSWGMIDNICIEEVPTPRTKCDSLYTFLNVIQDINQLFCCFDFLGDSVAPNCFTSIQLDLSSGSFLNIIANPNWMINTNGNQMLIGHTSGFIPGGFINPGIFCVGGAVNPFTINVSYNYSAGGVAQKCEERFTFSCPVLPFQSCACPSGQVPGPNLVLNGDFSQGNSGFTSNYAFRPIPLALGSGDYSIRNSTELVNTAWAGIDHTMGNALSNFFIADGLAAGIPFWIANVNVITTHHYSFCAFVNNLVTPQNNFTDPTIQLWINNTLQATTPPLPENPDVWVNLTANWTSSTTGPVQIDLRFGTPFSQSGCDIAVDDIAFHECLQDVLDTCCSNCQGNSIWQSVSNQFFIHDMVVYDGKLIIGGEGFNIGGSNNLAAWDGTNWHPLSAGVNGVVEALAVYNGKLYVGGTFSNPSSNIAEWTGTIPGGAWNFSFQGVSGGTFSRVASLLTSAIHGLVVGGQFTSAGTTALNNIGTWNGIIWSPLSNGINVASTNTGAVSGLGLYNGLIVAGGVFPTPLNTFNNIAIFNNNNWTALGGGINLIPSNFGQGVKAIQQFGPNQLAVGGRFMEAVNGSIPVSGTNFIAQWNGSTWASMNSGVNMSFEGIYDMKIHCGDLYVGGLFSIIGGNSISGVAHWDDIANSWTTASNHVNKLIRALENFDADSNKTCDLYSGGEVTFNRLTCATITQDLFHNMFNVFPNPTNSNLIIELDQAATSDYLISAFDICGINVINTFLSKGEKRVKLDMSQVATGFYLIELKDNTSKSWYRKVLRN